MIRYMRPSVQVANMQGSNIGLDFFQDNLETLFDYLPNVTVED